MRPHRPGQVLVEKMPLLALRTHSGGWKRHARSLARSHDFMIHDRGRAGGRTGVLIDERDGSGEKSRSRRRAG